MTENDHPIMIYLLFPLFLVSPSIRASSESSGNCTGREKFFMKLEYPNGAKPKPAFSLFEKQAISNRCFQFNASSGFAVLNPFLPNETFIYFTSDCSNIIDKDVSSCYYGDEGKNLTIQFSPQTVDPNFEVTIKLEVGFVTDIGRVFKSVVKEVFIEVSNEKEQLYEMFYKDLGNLTQPLGFATKCSQLLDRLPNKDASSQWEYLGIGFTDIIVQTYLFTRIDNIYNYAVTCDQEFEPVLITFPIVMAVLAVCVPLVIMAWAVRSVQMEQRQKRLELEKDLYALRTGCVDTMRRWFGNANAKITRFRFNSN